ncbi:MAG: hypothetical protein K0V04_30750 [Deltaproteobacteria bacterium]|nr:hypothetical protein [Deltaproteobacteria bacterium]
MNDHQSNTKPRLSDKELTIDDLKNIRGAMFEDVAKKSESTESPCGCKTYTETKN